MLASGGNFLRAISTTGEAVQGRGGRKSQVERKFWAVERATSKLQIKIWNIEKQSPLSLSLRSYLLRFQPLQNRPKTFPGEGPTQQGSDSTAPAKVWHCGGVCRTLSDNQTRVDGLKRNGGGLLPCSLQMMLTGAYVDAGQGARCKIVVER